jgi:hypothetical protein
MSPTRPLSSGDTNVGFALFGLWATTSIVHVFESSGYISVKCCFRLFIVAAVSVKPAL